METITKYITGILLVLSAVVLIYCLILRNQRDSALNQVEALNTQLDTTIKANDTLTSYISILEDQAKQNDKYITDLEELRLETEQKTTKQAEQFKHAKRNDQNITKWADVMLPARLY